ncbi:unnamed protein product, partial [Rotaria sordida]
RFEEIISSNNDRGNNDVVDISKQIETQVDNVIISFSSPVADETNSIIMFGTHGRSSTRAAATSITSSNDLSVTNRDSKLITTSPSIPSPSNSIMSASNQISSTDICHSSTIQRSNSVESTSKTTSSLEQQVTSRQPKQKHTRIKKVTDSITSKNYKRRSFFLRSKTKNKQQQLPIVTSSKRKQDGEHAHALQPTISLKKKKLNDDEKAATNYQTLTKTLGKIPKKKI